MNVKAKPMLRHPLSALFSRLDLAGEDLAALAEDIQAQGLLSPITTYEGMVLDGWNRYTACTMAGVEPVTIELHAGADPWEFVKGSNMLRRHMSPAERVAVMLLKMQMEGVKNDPPSLNSIEKDLEVSRGTAVKAAAIAKTNDPALTEALADKKVSLDRAAQIAKLPEPERKAALEAPKPKPEPAPEPKAPKVDSEEVAKLQERVKALEEANAEAMALIEEMKLDLDAAHRALDAEDLLKQFKEEIHRAHALAMSFQTRNNGLMGHNKALASDVKRYANKAERLEKKLKALEVAPDPEDVPALVTLPDDPDWFLREEGEGA